MSGFYYPANTLQLGTNRAKTITNNNIQFDPRDNKNVISSLDMVRTDPCMLKIIDDCTIRVQLELFYVSALQSISILLNGVRRACAQSL